MADHSLSALLDGRIAVITAAASGMGREASLKFAAQGAHVVAVDIDEPANAQLVADIQAAGGSAQAITCDMTDLAAISALVRQVGDEHGRIDVLYNHAGAPGPRGWDFDDDVWNFQVDLNLRAPVFLTKEAWPLLQRSDHASIIFTSSVSGLIASRNSPVYATLKTALIGFTRCMAAIGGEDGIRANAICPGGTETPMLAKFFADEGESEEVLEERLTSFKAAIPLGRMCTPKEVSDLALFLASDLSSYITGIAVPIDGGYVAL